MLSALLRGPIALLVMEVDLKHDSKAGNARCSSDETATEAGQYETDWEMKLTLRRDACIQASVSQPYSVDVLHNQNSLVTHLSEQSSQGGITTHGAEVQVVDIKAQMVGYCSHKAGLATAWGPIQEQAHLVRSSSAAVTGCISPECCQTFFDLQ